MTDEEKGGAGGTGNFLMSYILFSYNKVAISLIDKYFCW